MARSGRLGRRLRVGPFCPARGRHGGRTSMFTRSPMSPGAFLLLVPLATAVAHAAGSGDFAGLVDIGGGRKIYLECRGTGSPTVVLVGGLRASAEDWSIGDKSAPPVFPEVAKFTRVCAYDRPGTPVGERRAGATRSRSRLRRRMVSPICMRCCVPPAKRGPSCLSPILTAA
jgi:hypothetical protein